MSDIIPIDNEITTFSDYLNNNCRGILSARFGDGKSFFLNEFKKKTSDKYIFLTIYPVNYQVAENKDIFEFLKRDILLQILMTAAIDLSDEKYDLALRLWGFLSQNGKDIVSDIVELVTTSLTNIPQTSMTILRDNIVKFKAFSKKVDKSESDNIESYLDEFTQQKGGIYEFDPISQIIYQLITDLKAQSGKQVVLVIEDMDRIDPAHIFRILNVFSAHWDILDYSEQKLADGNPLNKYNLDKILLVCHFQNIKKISHHFYGEKTDFTGYIHKFSSSAPYEYSLKDVMQKWIYDNIPLDKNIFPDICKKLAVLIMSKHSFKEDITTNIRHITETLHKPKYNILNEYIQVSHSHYINSYNRVTVLLSILKDFRISSDDFLKNMLPMSFSSKDNYTIYYQISNLIGQCWLLYPIIFNNDVQFTYNNTSIQCLHNNIKHNLSSKISKLEYNSILPNYLVEDIQFDPHSINAQLERTLYEQGRYIQIFSYFQRFIY